MQKIKLEIVGIAYSQTQSGSYVLTLAEVAGKRKLPIVIGGFEAQAIAVELEKMVPNRPLTHDLIKSFCISYGVIVTEVIIYKFLEGVFYAKIICEKDGQITEIDSRTSDAIAIGVRFSCPIYSVEKVLEEVSNTNSSEESDDQDEEQEEQLEVEENEDDHLKFHEYSIDDLKKQLKDAIDIEDYELASRLKDEINERIN